MIIRQGTGREHAIAWSLFLLSYSVLFGVTLFLGRFVDAGWDKALLLLLNPDNYIPVLDELVILQTDWAAFYLAVLPLAWLIGYYSSRRSLVAQARARRVFQALAVLFGLWYGLGVLNLGKGVFWWGEYEYPVIFLPLGLLFFTGFYIGGNLFVLLDDENQRKLAQAIWLSFIAVFFVNLVGEDTIKSMVQRHRPLHSTYESWNDQIRIIPDEVVRGSYSYISGHTSSFWAQTIIFFMLIKSLRFRIPLLLLGLFHGYTRIYTAAHFPYCVMMATFFGIAVTALIYHCFWNHKHLPLLTMLLFAVAMWELGLSPVYSGALVIVSIAWFAVDRYRHRNSPVPEPLSGTLEWGRDG